MGEDDGARDLKPASAAELEESLSFALRYAGKRRVHHADDVMARVTAERLVQHLQQSGFIYVTWNMAPLTTFRRRRDADPSRAARALASDRGYAPGDRLALHAV